MIEFKHYKIEQLQYEPDRGRSRVKIVFMVDGEDEAAQLVKGCRSLGVRPAPTALKPEAKDKPESPATSTKPPKKTQPKAEEPAPEPEKEAKALPEILKDAPAEAKTDGAAPKGALTITKEMKEARFRGVIKMLHDQGFEDAESLLKVCTKILDKVPALKQAGLDKLDERIALALETLEDD